MVLSKKILAQIEQKHNIKLTDKQAGFMQIMFGRYIRPDWKMYDFEWGLRIALKLYPALNQTPLFDSPPQFEQLKLDADDFSLS